MNYPSNHETITWQATNIKLAQLKEYANNPRKITKEMLDKLAAHIKEDGYHQRIIVDNDYTIIGGHQRKKALYMAGYDDETEIEVLMPNRKLTPEEIDRLNIRDNLAFGEYDFEVLTERFDMDELLSFGMDKDMLAPIFDKALLEELGEEEKIELPEEATARLGDIYVLGSHRLMCGDSTNPQHVEKLLDGAKPILMVTDPPYGVEYDPKWREGADLQVGMRSKGKVLNDDRYDWSDAYSLFTGDIAYVWHSSKYTHKFAENIENSGFELICLIIWTKQQFALSRGDYHHQHEPLWYGVRKGKKHNWQGKRDQSTVWEIENNNPFGNSNKEETWGHGTQKPTLCMLRPILNNSAQGESVYDPFGGSGAINRIAKSRFGNRNNLLQDVLRGRMSSLNKSDMNDLNQLNSLGQQGLSEYQDVLGKISGMNQLGVDKWLNTQDELNQKRERFEEERNQEWPGGSGSDIVKYNVSPEISSIFANPNISSNPSVYTPSLRPNIHALAQYAQTVPVSHSETELESDLNQDMGGIKNYADFENTKIQKKREEERQRVLKSMSEAERVKELNRLYLERLEQYKEAAAKRDNLYNSSNVNGVNAFSWSKSNPSRDFNSFLKHSLGVPDNTPDNVRIISNLNKNLPLYLEEVKRADYYWDQYNKYYQDMMQLKGQMNSEEERQRLFKIAEENRIKQEQEQARIAEAERVRQEQLRAEQARIAEQQRQAQIEQDNILKAKQQALREFAGMQGGRMGTVEELQINNLLRQYFPPTDYRHWVLPAQSSGSSFKEAIARAKWNQMMDNRSKFISLAQQGFPGGILKFLSN